MGNVLFLDVLGFLVVVGFLVIVVGDIVVWGFICDVEELENWCLELVLINGVI